MQKSSRDDVEREAMSRAERERELRILGNFSSTKQAIAERDKEGESRRLSFLAAQALEGGRERELEGGLGVRKVGNLLPAPQAMAMEREREGNEEEHSRGGKRLRGPAADQVISNQGIIRGAGAAAGSYKEEGGDLMIAEELVSQYKSAIAELTFNSKPIITNLTIIAGENSHAAQGIATTICDHIIAVPKEQKLPSLYLLDSIVKNIGGEYVTYFAARLPEVFITAYGQVEPNLYMAMQHLFWTWRGVFPPMPLRAIETKLQFNPKPNGPTTSTQPTRTVDSPSVRPGHGIHVNPKYLEQHQLLQQSRTNRTEGVPAAESNGDAQIRQMERPALRETSKGWPDAQRPTIVPLNQRDHYVEPTYAKAPPLDYDYDFERRGVLRPDLSNSRNLERREQGDIGRWVRDGDTMKEHAVADERPQRYPRRNGYDSIQAPGARASGLDGQGYNRPPGPGRGGAFPVSHSLDWDTRGRGGESRGLRMDSRGLGLEAAEGRGHRVGPEGGVGQGFRLNSRGLGPEVGVQVQRMDSRGLGRGSQGSALDGRGLGPEMRGVGLESRALRPDPSVAAPDTRIPRVDGSLGSEVHGRESWQNVEEEEYVWEDMKPQVREQEQRVGDEKVDDWYAGDKSLGRPGSSSGRGRGSGMDTTGGVDSWRRPGGTQSEQYAAASVIRATLRRESEERSRLAMSQGGHGSRVAQEMDMDGAGLGPHSVPGLQSTQTQLPSLQVNAPHFSMSLPSANLPPRSGTPPIPPSTAGGSVQSGPGPFGFRQNFSSNPTQVSPYNNFSPVTPSSAPFSQPSSDWQLPHSTPSLPRQSLPLPQQQVKEEQVNNAQPMQEKPPLLPAPQGLPPSLPLLSQVPPSLLPQLPTFSQSQQSGQPPSGGPHQQFSQQTQSAVVTSQAQQAPISEYQQPTQISPPSNGQNDVQLALDSAAISELLKLVRQLPSSQNQIQSQQGQSQSQSHSQPQAQSQSQSQNVLPQASAGLGQTLQSVPGPSPSPGGPTLSFMQTSVYNPLMQLGNHGGHYSSGPGQILPSMLYSSQLYPRPSQPPLPPGPRPQTATTGNSVPQPPPAQAPLAPAMSQYDTLFKSLLAQGLISAPAATATSSVPPQMMGFQAGVAAVNANSTFFNPGTLQAVSSVQTFAFSSALVSSIAPLADNATTYTDAAATTSQTVVVKDDPIGTEFRPEILKERHEVVIDALYSDFPRQCKTCGLRFLEQEAHSKHMDWHVSRNRRQKSQKKVSRKWFVSGKEWLSGTGALTTEVAPSFFAAEVGAAPLTVDDEGENMAVPADYNQNTCALCGETFDDFYSDEKDEWMYKGAVYMNVPPGASFEGLDAATLGPIVHAKCQTESAATAELSDESEEVQPELMAADSVRMELDGGGGDDTAMPLLDNFDSLDSKEESSEMENRRKRVRY